MNELRRRERGLPERDRFSVRSQSGASILASLVIVAMLGAAALVADFSNTASQSQLAASTGSTASQQKIDITLRETEFGTRTFQSGGKQYFVRYACEQVAPIEKIKELQQACQRGFLYTIRQGKGADGKSQVTVTPTRMGIACPQGAPDEKCKNGKPALKACSTSLESSFRGTCSVIYCPGTGETCYPVGNFDEFKDMNFADRQKEGLAKALAGADTPQKLKELTSELGISSSDIGGLESDVAKQIEEQRKKAADARLGYDNAIAQLAGQCQGDPACVESDTTVKSAREKLAAEEIRLAELEATRKRLADAKVALTPCTGPGCDQGSNTQTQKQCETSPCTTTPPGPPGSPTPPPGPPGPPPNTFPPPSPPPPPGNQTPKPPGTCSAGQTICQGNTLYSRNSQCVDTPVQYCQYGCAQQQQQQQQSSNTSWLSGLMSIFGGGQQTTSGQCAQAPQQCQQPPQQPNPSGCQNGTWKPTYGPPPNTGTQTYSATNNTCVVGWQCVPNTGGDTGQLTAQLSCEPKIADVGMTLAISYSCSAGISNGSGFDTNGAQSGTSTATIANPQGNANTATYTLTCTNAGQTKTASCSVQVARPTIVLIANPASVESGKTSALGWVTSGMKSCVISSPDLPDFTAQNANNTSVNGTAITPALTSQATFVLNCNTAGGSTRQASTTVKVL